MTDATFVVNAKDFQQALEKALKAAPKKTRLPVLGEALVTFDGNICTLTCTNLEQWCQVYVPAVGEPCSFVLDGSRKLLTACKYFSGDLELSYLKNRPEEGKPRRANPDGTLTLCCNGKELRQRVTTAEDFPAIPKEEAASDSYSVDSAALYERFERIKYALSDNEARPVYECVKFFDERIGAVDGYRLAVSRDKSLAVTKPFYIPPGAMKLLPIFEGIFCTLTVGTRYAMFESNTARIITRMPEGEGLDFDKAIPKICGEEHTMSNKDAFWQKFAEICGEQSLSDIPLFDEFYAKEFQKAIAFCGFTPEAAKAVKIVTDLGLRVVLATNPIFPQIATENRIYWAGLSPSDFELYTTYENSHYCKPNPAYYTELSEKLNVQTEECLMVGNDVTEDMVAHTVGMKVFLLTDCLINKGRNDISQYPRGSFEQLIRYIEINS